ncbi:MAG: LacI family DNA-binding transcriptional regulator, partial [Pseudomonadota bacterium]
MATIYDVAGRAGVSPKTVSRVLNGDGPVSPRTREAVKAAMAHLGYEPSHAARSMKSRRSGLVGLVTGAISGTPLSGGSTGLPDLVIVQAIQQRLADSGLTLLIADTGGQADRIPTLLTTFRRHRVEGVLLVAPHHQPVDIPEPHGSVPTVLVNCFDSHDTPAILPEDEAGQHAITRRVLAEGHRRVAFLTISPARTAAPLRMSGYRRALAEAGLALDDAL